MTSAARCERACTVAPDTVVVRAPSDDVARVEDLVRPFVDVSPPTGAAGWVVDIVGPDGDVSTDAFVEVKVGATSAELVTCRVDIAGRVLLVVDDGSFDAPAFAARLVRILLRLARWSRDELFLHAAMVSNASQGVAVVGPKRSGKTSTALAALAAGMSFVSNDDLSVSRVDQDGAWIGRGWPRAVAVRTDSLAMLGLDRTDVVDRCGPLRHPENDVSESTLGDDASRVYLYPSEVAALFDARVVPAAPLGAVAFLRFRDELGEPPTVRRLAPGEASSALLANVAEAPVKGVDFLLPAFERAAPPDAIVAGIAHDVPCIEMVQSFDRLDAGARALTALLEGNDPR